MIILHSCSNVLFPFWINLLNPQPLEGATLQTCILAPRGTAPWAGDGHTPKGNQLVIKADPNIVPFGNLELRFWGTGYVCCKARRRWHRESQPSYNTGQAHRRKAQGLLLLRFLEQSRILPYLRSGELSFSGDLENHLIFLFSQLMDWVSIPSKQTNLCQNLWSSCWRRQWHPTPVLLPGKSHGQRSLVGCSPGGLEESDTTERLPFHFSLSCIGEGNGNPLQCSCLEKPRDGGAWWAAVYRVGQDWSDLAAAAAAAAAWSSCMLW